MEQDLRCFTLHFFYEIKDAEIYGGEGSIGYCETSLNKATTVKDITPEYFLRLSEKFKTDISLQLHVGIDKITAITCDSYDKETAEDDNDNYPEEEIWEED